MPVLTINDPLFATLRAAPQVNTLALERLVDLVNRNPVVNALLTVGTASVDDLRFRLAVPGDPNAGASFQYGEKELQRTGGFMSIVLDPGWLTGTKPDLLDVGLERTLMGGMPALIAHEADHYRRVQAFRSIDALADPNVQFPGITPEQRFERYATGRMKIEVMGWYTSMKAQQYAATGSADGKMATFPPSMGLIEQELYKVERRGIDQGLRGAALEAYVAENGAPILSRDRISNYWGTYVSAFNTGMGSTVIDAATSETIRGNIQYRLPTDGDVMDIVSTGGGAEPLQTHVTYRNGDTSTETQNADGSSVTVKRAAGGQTLETMTTTIRSDGARETVTTNGAGLEIQHSVLKQFDDGSVIETSTLANGDSTTRVYGSDGFLFSTETTTFLPGGNLHVERFDQSGRPVSVSEVEYFYDENGVSRIETVQDSTGVYRNAYDTDGQQVSSTLLSDQGFDSQRYAQIAATAIDVNAFLNALRTGQPIPILATGLNVASSLDPSNGSLATASMVAGGIASFYNLYNAMNSGDAFSKVNAALSAISYGNIALNGAFEAGRLVAFTGAGGSINTFLNGSGGLAAGGSVGVLPVLGLVASIKSEDPIGIAMSIGTMIQGSAFLATPVGWALIAASILRAIFSDDSPPDAWGVSKVTFGAGFSNLDPLVQAEGENFGPDRVRQQLQGIVDVIQQIIAHNNQATSDSNQWLGLVPQRMPGLTFRASEFADKGYAVSDIDPLTGAQRIPFLRFDDNGQPFGFVPSQLTAEERAMLTLPGADVPALVAYMLNSALQRGALAPLWEVRTAKMQEQAGDPNAGLTEEERAAKAGMAAAVDTQYAATHAADPQAKNRRVGHFMAVGLDLSGDGYIDTRSITQLHAAGRTITFDWDAQGYQKEVGWIGAADAFLVLDRDFNQSADQARELLSNPLIADPGKGLRVLTAYDGNGDGRIDAGDPVFNQLRVWQDLDQDGNNTHVLQIAGTALLAQDETGGVLELRTLQEASIVAIDFANGRYQLADGSFRLVATQTLDAAEEGTRYTPVGAGIQIKGSNGAPQILVTQVQSEAAVYAGQQIAASGETIGGPGAELYEDGLPTSYDPAMEGGPIEIVINGPQLLQNDTRGGANGLAAGLAITAVRAGAHTSVSLRADGNISLLLEANYNGAAEFFYTVAVPGAESVITPKEARVGLNITPVNDAPGASNIYSAERPIYGYERLPYTYTVSSGEDVSSVSGVLDGAPIYQPYVEHIPEEPGVHPAQDVVRDTVIATDRPNTGTVLASDPDSPGGSFHYVVVSGATYGDAVVDPNTGTWTYTGHRPGAFHVRDITGDGQRDWFNPATGAVQNAYSGDPNGTSNAYSRDELADSFADYFTVRVTDNSDPSGQTFRDVQVEAMHYGPAPLPIVADSGGGGKKPIAIDLDGDGFHFQDVDDSNVFFEANDGWKHRMAWTEPGDGLLAYDHDGNGKIEHYDEISLVPYAPGEQTDMAALAAAFDTNHDGRFDAADVKWASFGVWKDANSNGITDPGEFRGLYDMGISAINLSTDGQFRVIDGQSVHGVGSATLANGGSMAVADVTLRYSNETQVVTANADGSTSTQVVVQPAAVVGQDFGGTADKDLLVGTKGSDRFRSGDGDDVVVDDGGNDIVEAGAGNDQVYAGIDNDMVYGEAGDDVIYAGAGNDIVFGDSDGTAGDDMILLEDGNDVAFGGNGDDFISGGLGNDVISGNAGNDKLFGETGWDALFGQEGDDELHGLDGNDSLDGGLGNDLLAGGAGDDAMEGGAGDDTYQVDSAADTVIEAAAAGNDTVESTIAYTLGDNVENLRLFGEAGINGTGNAGDNLLVGNDQANTLSGLAGNDTLDGALGVDTLAGGAGDDLYRVENALDVVVENANEGADVVHARVTYTLSDNVENLVLVGPGALAGYGNALNNWMQGNNAANILDGRAGADSMLGRGGNDTYFVNDLGDWVVENAGDGIDTVYASVNYTLTANVENVVLTGSAPLTATGNELANWMEGNSGANVLDGRAGADAMLGNDGNDAYFVDNAGDQVIEQPGEGIDTVYASIGYTLGANVENLVLIGPADINGTGNGGWNWMQGNSGANTLDGGCGADAMYGGGGNDIYMVDDAGDVVGENANEGIDTVYSGVSYTLGANVENLVLTGDCDLRGTGNELANWMQGNAGWNRLEGGAGDDYLLGGAGDDYLRDLEGSNTFEGGADCDIVQAGAGADRLLGGANNDLLDASGGNDTVVGGPGDDWIAGGKGNDSIQIGNGWSLAAFNRGDGVDTVQGTGSGSGENAVSLGGGIHYADLRLSKAGNDLVLGVGQGESITFKDWYASASGRTVDRLQMVTVGGDYDAASADCLRDNKVEQFDFASVVQAFDQARAQQSANGTNWAVMNSLLDAHLDGSDCDALGGDMSYQYATAGGLAGIGLDAARSMIDAGGANMQQLRPRSELESGAVRLA
jgi:Ca2+-binding RTX toxin-like protein